MPSGGPGLTNNGLGELGVLQRRAVDALGDVVQGSLAYHLQVVNRHFHSPEQWYGRDAGDGFLNRDSVLSWTVPTAAGAGAYGAELQISDGTEIEGGDPDKRFDFHRLYAAGASQFDNLFKVEAWAGATTFAAASLVTEIVIALSGPQGDHFPLALNSRRVPCNHKLWLRAMSASAGPDSIDPMIGLHTYDA